jgi:acyl dehydratase
MNIDSSINPMPASRAERSSNPVDILANRLILDRNGAFHSSSWPGLFRPSTSFVPRCFKDVDARHKAGHDELRGIDCRNNGSAIPICHQPAPRRTSGMTEFDPALHRMVPQQRWFEDFALGERFVIPSRTMTTAVFAAFQSASGDTHPVHYDVEYCRARGMPNLLAHGFQTLIHTAPGSGLFPYMVEESLVGFLEQSSRFVKPVYADDTIYPALEVTELTPGRSTGVVTLRSTVFNQRRELVLEGVQKFLIRRRPAPP